MRLVSVLAIVLTQLSVGTLLTTSVLPPRAILPSFFQLNSLVSALSAAVALVLSKWLLAWAWTDVRFLGLTVIGATAAWGCFRLEKPVIGQLLLIVSGILGLLFGLLPLVHRAMIERGIQTQAGWMFDASMLAGMLLLGATHVGMVLGHWYLLMRRLSFVYLERFAKLLLGAVVLRILFFALMFGTLSKEDPALAQTFIPNLLAWHGDLFFFAMRLLFGLVGPMVLAVLVMRCVLAKANQAATGLLYVAEITVLFGELFAAYLLI